MAVTPIAINLNLNKRLPTGRPLSLDEGDENWDKIEVVLVDLVNQINISIGDAFTELIPNNSGIMMSDGIILGTGRLTGTTDWFLCDGQTQNGILTPNLLNLMIVGSGDEFNVGDTGGIDQAPDHFHSDPPSGFHAITVSESPSHDHPLDKNGLPAVFFNNFVQEAGKKANPSFSFAGSAPQTSNVTGTSGSGVSHQHPSGGNTGNAGAHDNKPRYFSLAFIKYCPGVAP